MFNKVKHSKLYIIILSVIIVSTLNFIITTKMAGYKYLLYTSAQMDIIPKDLKWEKRTIVQDRKQIRDVLSIISKANLATDLYSVNSLKCDLQSHELQLIVRRNFAKNDLSWLVCKDKDANYLVPLLGERNNNVYKTDKKLMAVLDEVLSEKNDP